MAATIQKVKALAKKLGTEIVVMRARVDMWGHWHDALAELSAPDGKVFNATDLHSAYSRGVALDKTASLQQALEGALKDLQDGLSDCTDPECEYCNPDDA